MPDVPAQMGPSVQRTGRTALVEFLSSLCRGVRGLTAVHSRCLTQGWKFWSGRKALDLLLRPAQTGADSPSVGDARIAEGFKKPPAGWQCNVVRAARRRAQSKRLEVRFFNQGAERCNVRA